MCVCVSPLPPPPLAGDKAAEDERGSGDEEEEEGDGDSDASLEDLGAFEQPPPRPAQKRQRMLPPRLSPLRPFAPWFPR